MGLRPGDGFSGLAHMAAAYKPRWILGCSPPAQACLKAGGTRGWHLSEMTKGAEFCLGPGRPRWFGVGYPPGYPRGWVQAGEEPVLWS